MTMLIPRYILPSRDAVISLSRGSAASGSAHGRPPGFHVQGSQRFHRIVGGVVSTLSPGEQEDVSGLTFIEIGGASPLAGCFVPIRRAAIVVAGDLPVDACRRAIIHEIGHVLLGHKTSGIANETAAECWALAHGGR